MTILDRYLGRLGGVRWAQALVLGTALLVLGDFIGKLGFFMRALGRGQVVDLLHYYAIRTPEMLVLWLPIAPLVAAMLTVAPMRRDGTLVALCASGLSPDRIFRAMLGVALLSGVIAWVLADRIIPALAPRGQAVEARLDGDLSGGAASARAAGWLTAHASWSVAGAYPAQGLYGGVAVRTSTPTRLVRAERMEWTTSGWVLHNILIVQGDRIRQLPWATPENLGLDAPPARDDLAISLRPVWDIPGNELPLDKRHGQAAFLSRLTAGLLPLCVLAWGLSVFIVSLGRRPLGLAAAHAILAGLGPLILSLIAERVLLTSRIPIPILAMVLIGLLTVPTWWRWRRMRL